VSEQEQPTKSAAERWFEEQQAWQKTMRDYADAAAKDEQFLMHLGNAMRGSLLGGAPYPEAAPPGAATESSASTDRLEEVLFTLKRIEGRLRDLEDAVGALSAPAAPSTSAAPSTRSKPTTPSARRQQRKTTL
jgi:hypothetical protein